MKIAMIALVIIALAVLLFLFYISQKMLRQVQKQEAAEKAQQKPERQLHPKLLEQQKEKKSGR